MSSTHPSTDRPQPTSRDTDRSSGKIPKPSRQVVGLIVWLIVTFTAAALGAWASADAGSFYPELSRPSWAPSASVFGPVWSVLYTLMAVAVWLVWRQGGWSRQRVPLILFLVQLAANALWSWLFFAWHLGGAATFEVVVLWLLIVATIGSFWRRNRLAAVLLVPYLAWVSFATMLCLVLWRMNPSLL